MRLQQHSVALLVPDERKPAAYYQNPKKYFDKQYEAFFIQDKYSHLAICIHQMVSHCLFT